ncbi:MAG: hypothetical protein JWR72_1612 [Flavisolibacter sp.]|nr:hypothetical protein [Flavisolibacter sp.]
MEENSYNLGVRSDEGKMFTAGIAYVIIPSDVTREQYIRECYKTKTVSIYSEFNGYTNRIPIDQYSLNFVKFPLDKKQYGSAVCFVINPIENRPIITGIYFKGDEVSDLQENQFTFKRELNGNIVEISGSPQDKFLTLNVISAVNGEISINVKSEDESGKININVDGDCNITSLNKTTLKQFDSLLFITQNRDDENELTFEEHTPTGRHIMSAEEKLDTESYIINDGKENFVLGQKLKTLFDDFITEVGETTVTTTLGKMPILNKAQVLKFKERTDEILSTVGFIDR